MDRSFSEVIREHLELQKRNAELEGAMTLDRYRSGDPTDNNALFRSEADAQLEDTVELDGVREEVSRAFDSASPVTVDASWGRARVFDWGD
jgi:hypothetical protein